MSRACNSTDGVEYLSNKPCRSPSTCEGASLTTTINEVSYTAVFCTEDQGLSLFDLGKPRKGGKGKGKSKQGKKGGKRRKGGNKSR